MGEITPNLTFKPTEEQEGCLVSFKENRFTTIQARAGTGKAEPIDRIVKTPSGDVMIGNLKIGDSIFRSDGSIGKVIGVFPQEGFQPTYEVTFRDGSVTQCNGEHLWTIFGGKRHDKYMTYTLNQIMERGLYNKSGNAKIEIPLTKPVQYTEKEYLIHPYVLGILIGDGYLSVRSAFSVGQKDAEIIDIVKEYHPKWNYSERYTSENCKQYNITTPNEVENIVTKELRHLGLAVKSVNKFIPSEYLLGSVEQRLSLLRGLMDSDGCSSKNRTSFTSTSKVLIKDLKCLVQSLGGTAIEVRPDVRSNNPAYTLNIKMFENPFKVQSKASLWTFSSKNPPSRYMTNIRYVGETEQVCIAVDAEDQLYLTDEFIVTHNTSTLKLLAESTQERVLYLAFNKAMAEEARRKMPRNVECRTLHSMCYQYLDDNLRHKLTRPEGNYVNVAATGGEIAKKFKIGHLISDRGQVLVNKSMIGLMIKQTLAAYEFSDSKHIERDHFPGYHLEELEKKGVNTAKLITDVVRHAKQLWRERVDPESVTLMTHDTYVKLFQLSGADLGYDIIFGDEFQDVNPAFLSILKNAKSAKKIVVVGDEFQSIYQFRGSQNMMKETSLLGAECELSASFRFGQRVGDLACTILSSVENGNVKLTGLGYDTKVGSKASPFIDTSLPYTIIFRKNLTLLTFAMDKIADGIDLDMNVDTKDFVAMVDSVNALKKGELEKVRHESILPYATWEEFVEDAESNPEAKSLLNIIVTGSAGKIAHTLRTYKPSKNAKITLTTAHKSKGLEYDQVVVADDFPSNYDKDGNWVGLEESERNLLYVAHTRAKQTLQWNTTVQEIIDILREERKNGTSHRN